MQGVRVFLVAALAVLFLASPSAAAPEQRPPAALAAVIGLAADRIDDTFTAVADSAAGLGQAYLDLYRQSTPATPDQVQAWMQNYAIKDAVVSFRPTGSPCGPEPGELAPCPTFLYYGGEEFTEDTFRQLKIFSCLSEAFRAAYAAFPFSWVYMTTVNESFLIYPYLPINEAVYNYKPTEKPFYTAADFQNRACGWLSPYLDLAGQGMMVTVSCPVYDQDKLLGVVSRDITLRQLSKTVLDRLTAFPGAKAVIMTKRGKAVAASDPKLATAIDQTNEKASDAVVYFRADRGLATLDKEGTVASPDAELNAAAEDVLEQAKTASGPQVFLTRAGKLVLATRTKVTGWYVMLVVPAKAVR